MAVPRQLWYSADLHGEQRRLCHAAGLQSQRAAGAHRRLSAAVLTVRRASVLFASHDPLRPLMDGVLAQTASVGEWQAASVVMRWVVGVRLLPGVRHSSRAARGKARQRGQQVSGRLMPGAGL